MEENEINTTCRLCLSRSATLINIFDSNGIQGLSPAETITDLLRFEASPGDIYPQNVCTLCEEKLTEFTKFKKRCVTCKELLDCEYDVKCISASESRFEEDEPNEDEDCTLFLGDNDVDNNEASLDMNDRSPKAVPTSLSLDVNKIKRTRSLPLEEPRNVDQFVNEQKDVMRSIEACDDSNDGNVSCISEQEVHANTPESESDEGESIVDGKPNDVMSSSSVGYDSDDDAFSFESDSEVHLNKPDEREMTVIGEPKVAVEGETSSTEHGNCDIPQPNEGCSKQSGNKLDILPPGLPSTSKRRIFRCDDCCQPYPSLEHLQWHRIWAHGVTVTVIPTSSSAQENTCSEIKYCTNNEDIEKSRFFPTWIIDPLHLPLETTATEKRTLIETEEQTARFTVTPSPKKLKDVDSGKNNSIQEDVILLSPNVSSEAHSNSAKNPNNSSNTQALRPPKHESSKELNKAGANLKDGRCEEMEKRNKGRLQKSFDGKENKYRCNVCKIYFATKTDLEKHITTGMGCDILEPRVYFSYELVGRNQRSVGGKNEMNLELKAEPKVWECKQCRETFGKKRSLTEHLKLHAGERSFKCTECGMSFSRLKSLKRHIPLHTGVKLYSCLYCGQRFNRLDNMQCHMRTQKGPKPFNCEICDKQFSAKCVLNLHFRTHIDVKPFQCEKCGKFYKHDKTLQHHLRTHKGEKV